LTIIFNVIGVDWLYKGLEQYTYITVRSIIFKFISLIVMLLLIKEQNDYVIYGGITILAGVGSNVLNFMNIRKYIYIYPIGKYNFKRHLKKIALFFAMSMAINIYTNLDNVMLGFMANDKDVGYYNAAVKIKGLLVSFVTSLGVVLLPRVSYYVEKGMHDEFERITKKAFNFVILLTCPVTIYFMLFAKEGILFFSGKAYMGSVVPMQIIMPTVLLIGMTNISSLQILIPIGKEKIVLYSQIAGAIVNLTINAILIPKFASSGAAIGTLAAELVVFAVQFFVLKDISALVFKQIFNFKLAISLVSASILSIWVKALNLPSIKICIISACIFFGVYGLLLNIFREPLVIELENQILGKYLKKIKSS